MAACEARQTGVGAAKDTTMSSIEFDSHGQVGGRRTRCSLSEVLRWCGVPELVDGASDAAWLPLRTVHAGSTLVAEAQPLEWIYAVVAGSFKSLRIDHEGYEQVLGFALQGDLLGLDAVATLHHGCSVVALEDSAVAAIPASDVSPGHAAGRLPALEHLVWHALGLELQRRAETQYQMSAPSSEVRVARFLLELAARQRAIGHSGRSLNLTMSRRDIANSLGVAHESVSRALAVLAQAGCLQVHNRSIDILDGDELHALQRITRGAPRARALRHAHANVLMS